MRLLKEINDALAYFGDGILKNLEIAFRDYFPLTITCMLLGIFAALIKHLF